MPRAARNAPFAPIWAALLAGAACVAPPPEADALTVVSTSPEDGALDVATDARVRVTFSDAIDPATLDDASFSLTPATLGALTWDAGTRTATFSPGVALQAATPYRVRLSTALGLATDVDFAFTTAAASAPPVDPASPDATWTFGGDRVTLTLPDPDADLRTYALTTTHPLRDGVPGARTVTERADRPRLRTGDPLFDAMFAMAVDDATQASVTQIADGGFDQGAPTPCDCFETGERWTYVWTRDTAYAVDLALAWLDPTRAANSLAFKLSRPKGGGPLQIVQDTGSGGSWPVSTDRVVWALGAEEALKFLDGDARAALRRDALEALDATFAADDAAIFDPTDGLFRGEQSFLDWREQSYPPWTASDVTALAQSKALSTNVLHAAARRVRDALAAEDGAPTLDADPALRAAIEAAFWLEDDGQLSTFRLSDFDPAPDRRFDLLGASLAVLEGVVPADRAARVVAAYPHAPLGPPVIWPQQPATPIYHNRAIWPFVTAYGLAAARAVDNPAVFDHDAASLVRGAALNLSNMENFEFLSGRNWVDAGAESGPVVNSRRQLWSVAGYLHFVVSGLFGMEATQTGLRFQPYVTPTAHRAWMGAAAEVTLRGFPYRGRAIDVTLALPAAGAEGDAAYAISAVTLDGVDIGDRFLTADDLTEGAQLRVSLTAAPVDAPRGAVTVVTDDGDFRRFWPPPAPAAPTAVAADVGARVTWPALAEPGVVYDLYRDGARVAANLREPAFDDLEADPARSVCYAVSARYDGFTLQGQHSPPACVWGEGFERVLRVGPHQLVQTSGDGTWSTAHGKAHHQDWGAPGDTLTAFAVVPPFVGPLWLQLEYGNGAGPINTGITAAAKRVDVWGDDGAWIGGGVAVLPQRGTWDTWGDSTLVPVTVPEGVRSLTVQISDAPNMSDLDHFRRYTGGQGGGDGAYHFVNVHALKLLARTDAPSGASDGRAVDFTGVDDIGAHAPTQRLSPGVSLQPWSAFALSWDADFLYLTQVSQGFEADFAPWMVYLEADPAGEAAPADGAPYTFGAVTGPARLPFTPTHRVSARAVEGVGPDGGPWPGVYAADGSLILRFEQGVDRWLAADRHTLSVRVPRAALGHPRRLRLASHLLWGAPGQEWKEAIPFGHAPWDDGGAAYEIDLDGPSGPAGWAVLP
jgi:hypothetical protein